MAKERVWDGEERTGAGGGGDGEKRGVWVDEARGPVILSLLISSREHLGGGQLPRHGRKASGGNWQNLHPRLALFPPLPSDRDLRLLSMVEGLLSLTCEQGVEFMSGFLCVQGRNY